MTPITEADRRAAQDLRVILADISGFWHQVGDDSPLCLALARHRREAEGQMMDKLVPLFPAALPEASVEPRRSRRSSAVPRSGEIKLSA